MLLKLGQREVAGHICFRVDAAMACDAQSDKVVWIVGSTFLARLNVMYLKVQGLKSPANAAAPATICEKIVSMVLRNCHVFPPFDCQPDAIPWERSLRRGRLH